MGARSGCTLQPARSRETAAEHAHEHLLSISLCGHAGASADLVRRHLASTARTAALSEEVENEHEATWPCMTHTCMQGIAHSPGCCAHPCPHAAVRMHG